MTGSDTFRRHGLLARRQWLGGGLSQRQLDGAIAKEAIVVVHPGVYAVRGSKASFERDVMAACLATGGVASHRCAAYLWKFRKFAIPVTTRARTLLDLVAVRPALVEGALDGALHRRGLNLRAVQRMLERAGEKHPPTTFSPRS